MVSAELQQRFGKVGVLYGGTSSERPVSLQSGEAVIASLTRSGVTVVAVDADRDLLRALPTMGLDRVLIMLHGSGGEDGTLQGALELLDLPYTGSGVLASALAMDKLRSKRVWRGEHLPTADFVRLEESTDWQQAIDLLGGKAMVKPAREGSSFGMTSAASAIELESAWREAARFDAEVMAEQWINGPEYTVAILGDQVLPPIRLETDHEFYDYDAKYLADDTRYLCPCGLDAEKEQQLQVLAKQAFESLGCSGWGRVDVMLNEQGQFMLLEVNTVPGMTSHSLVPMAANAAGYDFDALVLKILESSLG